MPLGTLLAFVTVFFAGILAGVEVVIHYGLRGPATVLDERSQLQLRQALIFRLRVLVPAIFLPTLGFGVAVAIRDAGAPGVGFRIVGLAALLIWMAIRVVGTVPINRATLTWQPDAPPADWQAQVEHAERFHMVGAWAAIIAFAAFLAGVIANAT
jgi:multisubunit Na+/H+ antiporter MnhB subunit